MSQVSVFNRVIAAVGLVGVTATLLAPQSASAFYGLKGTGAHGGGSPTSGRPTRGPSGGSFTHINLGNIPLRGSSDRHPNPNGLRYPGRLPIRIDLPPAHRTPIHIPPHRRLPPPVIVRIPPRILPPPVIVGRVPARIVHVGLIGAAPVIQSVRPVVAAAAPAQCAVDGSFVSIVFVPTVIATDITGFLKAYNVTIADGPNADGIYRIRLSTAVLPQNDVLQVIESMRTQTAIVSSVDGA